MSAAQQAAPAAAGVGAGIGNFIVTDRPVGTGIANVGHGFAMSTDEMKTELERLETLRERIEVQIARSEPLAAIVSPGNDPASLSNTEACNNSGRYYLGHLDRQSQFLGTVITKMRDALGITEQTEQQAGEDVTKQGGGLF